MDPDRKRKIRLGVALAAAVLLAAALVYTSFSASTEAKEPSEIINSSSGSSYDLTGVVAKNSVKHQGSDLDFRIRDRDDTTSVPVVYSGEVPDPFREGREVVVTGKLQNGTFEAQRYSLVTRCPSMFTEQARQDPNHVVITQ